MLKVKGRIFGSIIIIIILSVSGCAKKYEAPDVTESVEIDWVDFIFFEGITYEANGVYDPEKLLLQIGKDQPKISLLKEFDVVSFNVSDNVHELGYQIKNGDAAFLPKDTIVYEVSGYSSAFRLGVAEGKMIKIYEATTHKNAKLCKDLFDIEGKTSYITINSEEDGTTILGKIDDSETVAMLEEEFLKSDIVDITKLSETMDGINTWNSERSGERYFLTFQLNDGTSFSKSYWIESGALGSNITLSSVFKEYVREALKN